MGLQAMTPDIDELALGAPVVRLAIRLKTGTLILHDLYRHEAAELRDALDDALGEMAPVGAICPTWDGGPSPFSPEILAEWDRAHPLRQLCDRSHKGARRAA
jgi:hypothetical protein